MQDWLKNTQLFSFFPQYVCIPISVRIHHIFLFKLGTNQRLWAWKCSLKTIYNNVAYQYESLERLPLFIQGGPSYPLNPFIANYKELKLMKNT